MIAILGRSGSGKSSLVNKFIKTYPVFQKVITYTTRPCRQDEKDGSDYKFITDKSFWGMWRDNKFSTVGQYKDWFYGISSNIPDRSITIMTPKELRELKKYGYNITSVLLDVDRRTCLMNALKRGDDIEEAYRRNLSDVGMFDGLEEEVDVVINNHGFEKDLNMLVDELANVIRI